MTVETRTQCTHLTSDQYRRVSVAERGRPLAETGGYEHTCGRDVVSGSVGPLSAGWAPVTVTPLSIRMDVIAAQATQRLTADRVGVTRRPAQAKLKVRR